MIAPTKHARRALEEERDACSSYLTFQPMLTVSLLAFALIAFLFETQAEQPTSAPRWCLIAAAAITAALRARYQHRARSVARELDELDGA